ncbi:MAG TPA: DUF4124 domain-containing protein [Luteimonas sp.]|nr:DUF4124 domain-containing protein [Luteimonas sp.]
MHTGWAIAAGLAVGIGLAWWLSRETPARDAERRQRAEQAAAANAEDARPVLYRWTDEAGTLQVTQQPPPRGRRFEKVDVRPRDGIEIDGSR